MNCSICSKKYFYYYTMSQQVYCCFNCGIEIKGIAPCINHIDSINIKSYIFYFDIEPTYSVIIIYDSKDYYEYDYKYMSVVSEIKNFWDLGIKNTKIEQKNINNIINILNKYTENLMFV